MSYVTECVCWGVDTGGEFLNWEVDCLAVLGF